MKTKELHAMSMDDLQKQLKNSRQELFNLRFQMATGQLGTHRQIRMVRRTHAQVMTEIHEKEFAAQSAAQEAPAEEEKPRRRTRSREKAEA
jgi:large subunit ribosomal protein L29